MLGLFPKQKYSHATMCEIHFTAFHKALVEVIMQDINASMICSWTRLELITQTKSTSQYMVAMS